MDGSRQGKPGQRAGKPLHVLVVGRAHRVARALPAGPPAISADGRFVAFVSDSEALVDGDRNGRADVFVRDTIANRTVLVSRSRTGGSAAGCSVQPSISADGQVVAFTSSAPDLVNGDSNGTLDVFVHDLRTGRIDLISRGSNGELGDRDSYSPSLSADGRYVAFSSLSDLDALDLNDVPDVYRHDRVTGRTILVSVSSTGVVGDGPSGQPAISADGRVVAFTSIASNLHADDDNASTDVYVRDVGTGTTELASRGLDGRAAGGSSTEPAISADGRTVAFTSSASDLVPGDDNGRDDIFVRSLDDGDVRAVSTTSAGAPAAGESRAPSISADGRRVAFLSDAPDLAGGPAEHPAGGLAGHPADDGDRHAYVRDLTGAGTALVSFAAGRVTGDGESSAVAISGSGEHIAFTDSSTDLAGHEGASSEDAGSDDVHLYVAPLRVATVPRRSDETDVPPPDTV